MRITIILLLSLTCLSFAQQEQKNLYAGLRLGGSIGMVFPTGNDYRYFYENDGDGTSEWWDGGSFDVAPFISYQITNTFAIHTEVMATRFGYFGEKYKYDNVTEKFLISRRALLIPLLAKYTRRQFKQSLQLYIGPHFTYNFGRWRWNYWYKENGSVSNGAMNAPVQDRITEHVKYPPVGITIGTNFGIITNKAGTVFADVRFSEDLGMVRTGEELDDGTIIWSSDLLRGKLSFSLGWEFGFSKKGSNYENRP